MKIETFNPIFMSFLQSFKLPIVYNHTKDLPMAFWYVNLDNKVKNGDITIIKGHALIVNKKRIIGITLLQEKDEISICEIKFLSNGGYVECSPSQLANMYVQFARANMIPAVLPLSYLLIGAYKPVEIQCELDFISVDTQEI